jgi:putative DNA primase/helicase
LLDKLKAELPGILAWAVRGCPDWQECGLVEPDEVREATKKYRAAQDSVQGFLDECCLQHPEARVKASTLLDAYHEWSGDKLMTVPGFRERMKDKGFENKRYPTGWFWLGIGLLQAGEDERR